MSQVQLAADQQDLILYAASRQYNVPQAILKGVYGLETDFGRNVATSSAGAQGAFQFLPSTAKQYGYPETNDVAGGSTFTQQADAAAHYLSDLAKQHGGNWDAALKAYSGGGYGLAQVQAKSGGQSVNNALQGPIGAAANAANAVSDIPGAISGAFNQAVKDAKYGVVLIGVLIVAVVLITHGLGGQSSPTNRRVPIPV